MNVVFPGAVRFVDYRNVPAAVLGDKGAKRSPVRKVDSGANSKALQTLSRNLGYPHSRLDDHITVLSWVVPPVVNS